MEKHPNWDELRDLRSLFLGLEDKAGFDSHDYWNHPGLLESYDRVFGRRILWKWRAVFRELELRQISLDARLPALDWGCGSGVAAEALLEAYPHVGACELWDRSALARDFAASKILKLAPNTNIQKLEHEPHNLSDRVLLLSHVLDELGDSAYGRLLEALKKAPAILWIESATKKVSRRLSAVRDHLVNFADFETLAPCPFKQGLCGMLSPGNEMHWCHFFADSPQEVFHDGFWNEAAKRLNLDLRALPYSFLVLQKKDANVFKSDVGKNLTQRIIGEPRVYKGYQKIQLCHGSSAVDEFTLQKRTDGELFKGIKKTPAPGLAHFAVDGREIVGGKLIT